jgi:hypothetical protein
VTCEGVRTSELDTAWYRLFADVCIDYTDPATMRELKLMLAEVSGVATRVDATIWTTADEGALSLANAELDLTATELGKWNELGWYIPKRWTPHHLLHALGYPDKPRLFVDYPLLTRGCTARSIRPLARPPRLVRSQSRLPRSPSLSFRARSRGCRRSPMNRPTKSNGRALFRSAR